MTRFGWVVILGLAACGQVVDKNNQDAAVTQGPGAPTAVTATANINAGARLSWAEPATGAPITSYTVTASPAGGTVKVVGTNAIVTGLTLGTPYTFTVTATNAAGDGPASEPSNSVTIVAGPAAPLKPFACGADASATIRAPAPATGTTYNLYYDSKPGSGKLGTKQSNVTLPLSQAGLANGTKMYFVLTAVDGNGIESDDSPEDSTTPDSVPHDMAFGGSFSVNFPGIDILDCVSKQSGMAPGLGRTIRGAATMYTQGNYNTLAVDAAHARIYSRQANAILIWDNATTVDGNVAPTRVLNTSQPNGRGIAYDSQRDLLYVANTSDIQVYANVSTAPSGNTAAARAIVFASGNAVSLAIDVAADRLYVGNINNVMVFDNASTINGSFPANRAITINGAAITSFGVAIDPMNNTLYVSSRNENRVYAIANASTANGAVTPVRTITPTLPLQPMGIGLAGPKLFLFSDSATSVQIWDGANTLNGTVAPTVNQPFSSLTQGASIVYVP